MSEKGGDISHKKSSSRGADEQIAKTEGEGGVEKAPCVAARVSLEQHLPSRY